MLFPGGSRHRETGLAIEHQQWVVHVLPVVAKNYAQLPDPIGEIIRGFEINDYLGPIFWIYL